jgi:hypothetical protein
VPVPGAEVDLPDMPRKANVRDTNGLSDSAAKELHALFDADGDAEAAGFRLWFEGLDPQVMDCEAYVSILAKKCARATINDFNVLLADGFEFTEESNAYPAQCEQLLPLHLPWQPPKG